MEKKYQVFISSTYQDLKEERSGVTEALLSLVYSSWDGTVSSFTYFTMGLYNEND